MRRSVMLVSGWALATVAATGVGLVALGTVTDQVAPSQALPPPTSTVALSTEDETVPLPEPTEAAPTDPAESGASTPPPEPHDAADTDPPDGPAPPADQPPSATPPADDPPPADPETPSRTEGYELIGGVVTVRYADGAARLVQAAPSSGFDMDVRHRGPKVDVRFRSDDHESRFVAEWSDGAPAVDRDERER